MRRVQRLDDPLGKFGDGTDIPHVFDQQCEFIAAYARDRHIRIEYFFAEGSAARRRRLAVLSAACVMLFFAGLAVLGARMTWDEIRFAETTSGMSWPKWPFTIWLPILALLIAARALGLLRRVLHER